MNPDINRLSRKKKIKGESKVLSFRKPPRGPAPPPVFSRAVPPSLCTLPVIHKLACHFTLSSSPSISNYNDRIGTHDVRRHARGIEGGHQGMSFFVFLFLWFFCFVFVLIFFDLVLCFWFC